MLWQALKYSILAGILVFLYFGITAQGSVPKATINSRIPQDSLKLTDGIDYLNEVREGMGLAPFALSNTLSLAAQNHAKYISELGIITHDESENSRYFSGATPQIRAIKVGHNTSYVTENISGGHASINESIDGLLSAIYHRFNFLNYSLDSIGYFKEQKYYVFEMSNTRLNELCKNGDSVGQWFVTGVCDNDKKAISKTNFDKIRTSNAPFTLVFPNENSSTLAVFGSEDPDPLPQCKITSAPVSVEFKGDVKLKEFQIFKEQKALENTFLLSQDNDVNNKLTNRQFALFSLLPFEFGALYEAQIVYEKDGTEYSKKWNFRTKEPEFPYFVARDNDVLEVESGKSYELFFAPSDCNDELKEYSYKKPVGASFEVFDSGVNMIRFKAVAANNSIIKILANGHNTKIVVKNNEKTFDFKGAMLGILAIIVFLILLRNFTKGK